MTQTSKQVKNSTPLPKKVTKKNPNPTGKGGFQDHPENRSDGHWVKGQTFRYWFDFFKEMTIDGLKQWMKDNPTGKRLVIADLALIRVTNARTDLKEFQEVADRSEGKVPQTIVHEGGLFSENQLQITTIDDKSYTEQETGDDAESPTRPNVS